MFRARFAKNVGGGRTTSGRSEEVPSRKDQAAIEESEKQNAENLFVALGGNEDLTGVVKLSALVELAASFGVGVACDSPNDFADYERFRAFLDDPERLARGLKSMAETNRRRLSLARKNNATFQNLVAQSPTSRGHLLAGISSRHQSIISPRTGLGASSRTPATAATTLLSSTAASPGLSSTSAATAIPVLPVLPPVLLQGPSASHDPVPGALRSRSRSRTRSLAEIRPFALLTESSSFADLLSGGQVSPKTRSSTPLVSEMSEAEKRAWVCPYLPMPGATLTGPDPPKRRKNAPDLQLQRQQSVTDHISRMKRPERRGLGLVQPIPPREQSKPREQDSPKQYGPRKSRSPARRPARPKQEKFRDLTIRVLSESGAFS
eukprot:RCo036611